MMAKLALSLKSIETLLNEKSLPIMKKIECLHSKVEEAVHSLNFPSDKYDELLNKVNVLENDNKQLSAENQRLKSESQKLSNDCASLKVACDKLEQFSIRYKGSKIWNLQNKNIKKMTKKQLKNYFTSIFITLY